MVNKSTIQALYDAGYTDRELVESFPNLTYKIVRSLLKTPPALSQGARNEIHENHKDTDEKYISSIAKEYRTSPSLVRTAITEPPGRMLLSLRDPLKLLRFSQQKNLWSSMKSQNVS